VLNGPTAGSTTGERTITTGTQAGTYAVNCDGSGTVTRTLTASNDVVTNQVDDFIITRAIMKDGQLTATEIADAVETPSALVPDGIFVTRVHTRMPDAQSAGSIPCRAFRAPMRSPSTMAQTSHWDCSRSL
jgi:hypothetical protein